MLLVCSVLLDSAACGGAAVLRCLVEGGGMDGWVGGQWARGKESERDDGMGM